jgi:hypothetical protein
VLGRVERALEVVEHRQELRDEPLARAGVEQRQLAGVALEVVVEVRGDAPQVVPRRVGVALGVLEPRVQLLDGGGGRLARRDRVVEGRRAALAVPARLRAVVLAVVGNGVFAGAASSITA